MSFSGGPIECAGQLTDPVDELRWPLYVEFTHTGQRWQNHVLNVVVTLLKPDRRTFVVVGIDALDSPNWRSGDAWRG